MVPVKARQALNNFHMCNKPEQSLSKIDNKYSWKSRLLLLPTLKQMSQSINQGTKKK